MKILIVFALFLFLVVCCSKTTRETTGGDELFRELYEEHKISKFDLRDSDIDTDGLILSSPDNGIIYVLNSTCSRCIMEFLTFIDKYKYYNCQSPVSVIVSSEDSTTLKYYLEEFNVCDCVNKIVRNVDSKIVKDLEACNGVVILMDNNKITHIYRYDY